MKTEQNANTIYNVGHVDSMFIHGMQLPSSSSRDSSEDDLKTLITAAYNNTVKYRKILNSNKQTEEDEMSIFDELHASVQDLYFFYEKNEDSAEGNIRLSIVSAYNKFLLQFQEFLEARNTARSVEAKIGAEKSSIYFNDFVIILLANIAKN